VASTPSIDSPAGSAPPLGASLGAQTSAPAGAPADTPLSSFLAEVRAALQAGRFESLVLSKPRDRGADLKSVRVRRIALHGEAALSFTFTYPTRDVTKNLVLDPGVAELGLLLDVSSRPSFAHATLHARGEDLQLMLNRKGHGTLRRHPRPSATPGADAPPPSASAEASSLGTDHDRQRARRLSLDLPFVVELGLADAQHRLVRAMARKWRQIDKFLEVLDHALDALPPRGIGGDETPLRVVDFGSGKGYLTFAVHEHLRRRFGRPPQVTGVELRAELVDFCNAAAERCAMRGLRFVQGDLRSHAPGEVDVMIALHACDTATDYAIDLGLRAGARVLVCSPCCHKELRPQMHRPPALAGVLRHGIHLGQEAEMVTDSLRALLLESCGYEARVFEFVSLEHTSKNKMILATRRAGSSRAEQARAEVREVKDFYGIREQCLETLLERRGALAKAGAGDVPA
jgi:SAM-dependent methyltransferase